MIIKRKLNYDKLGIITSVACTIHCTILPLLINVLPILGFPFGENKLVEYGMILLSFIFGTFSLLYGYATHHHKRLPIILFALGFLCLIINQLLNERLIYILIPASAVGIITAHILNIRCCRKADNCNVSI